LIECSYNIYAYIVKLRWLPLGPNPTAAMNELRSDFTKNISVNRTSTLTFLEMKLFSKISDVYEREYFSKYSKYGYKRRKIGFNLNCLWELKKKKYFLGRRTIIPPNANIDPSLKLKISYIPIMMMVCTENVY
jgi:hypothetical protein